MRIIIAALLLISIPLSVLHAADFGEARLGLIKGDVQIYTEDTQSWVPAAVNTPLYEDDRVWVPEGAHAEIQLQGGIYIRLDHGTAFDVIALESDDYQFHLEQGRVYVNNRLGGIDHIQIDTPLTSISSYDNSLISIDASNTRETEVSVIKGYSVVETANGRTRVTAGQSLLLHQDMSAEIAPLPPPDQWEKWNQKRDRKLAAAGESLRYLPNELDSSAPDLDENGSWIFNPEFGYVWQPRLALTPDWAPYRDGRWIWSRGTYVWVSYEPWGWGPYHYGRWAYVSGYGWVWVPPHRNEVIWSPGYVAWVEYRDGIAWVPLAPGEIYYGSSVRRPGGININVNIGASPVRQTYRNASIKNSVTIINRETFISGRKKPVSFKDNPFSFSQGSTNAPSIKPSKETAAPVLKQLPSEKKPPETVFRSEPKQIRKERKIRRNENENILRQENSPENLPVVNRPEPRRNSSTEQPDISRQKPEKPSKKERQDRRNGTTATPSGPAKKELNDAPEYPENGKALPKREKKVPARLRGQEEKQDKENLKQNQEERREKKERND